MSRPNRIDQHPPGLGQRDRQVGDVLQHLGGDGDVEARGWEGEPLLRGGLVELDGGAGGPGGTARTSASMLGLGSIPQTRSQAALDRVNPPRWWALTLSGTPDPASCPIISRTASLGFP